MIVNVVIVSIGIGVVIEVVTPNDPPNIVALDIIPSSPFQQHPKVLCHGCLIRSRTCLVGRFHIT